MPEFYISFIKWLIILSLLVPINVKAQEIKIEYQDSWNQISSNNALYPPNWAVVEKLRLEYESQIKQKIARKSNGRYSCVAWGKKVTGVYGTWGDGGHKLSLNSNGQIGDVLIFKGTHVAVVTARVGQILTITEANYDYHGHIRTREISLANSSIKGFHKF